MVFFPRSRKRIRFPRQNNMIKYLKLLSLAALATFAMSHVANAKECTLAKPSGGDDTPQLAEALKNCGTSGTVTIPSGKFQVKIIKRDMIEKKNYQAEK